jgi:hypothetical protein
MLFKFNSNEFPDYYNKLKLEKKWNELRLLFYNLTENPELQKWLDFYSNQKRMSLKVWSNFLSKVSLVNLEFGKVISSVQAVELEILLKNLESKSKPNLIKVSDKDKYLGFNGFNRFEFGYHTKDNKVMLIIEKPFDYDSYTITIQIMSKVGNSKDKSKKQYQLLLFPQKATCIDLIKQMSPGLATTYFTFRKNYKGIIDPKDSKTFYNSTDFDGLIINKDEKKVVTYYDIGNLYLDSINFNVYFANLV